MSAPAGAKSKHSHSDGEAKFKWDDPLLLEEQLTEEERLIRDTARAFAQDKLAPRIKEAYLNEHTDRAIFTEMGALGLIGVTLPSNMAAPAPVMCPTA